MWPPNLSLCRALVQPHKSGVDLTALALDSTTKCGHPPGPLALRGPCTAALEHREKLAAQRTVPPACARSGLGFRVTHTTKVTNKDQATARHQGCSSPGPVLPAGVSQVPSQGCPKCPEAGYSHTKTRGRHE